MMTSTIRPRNRTISKIVKTGCFFILLSFRAIEEGRFPRPSPLMLPCNHAEPKPVFARLVNRVGFADFVLLDTTGTRRPVINPLVFGSQFIELRKSIFIVREILFETSRCYYPVHFVPPFQKLIIPQFQSRTTIQAIKPSVQMMMPIVLMMFQSFIVCSFRTLYCRQLCSLLGKRRGRS